MKVLLRDSRTGLYCGNDGQWVPQFDKVVPFEDIRDAGLKAKELEEVDVVLKYTDPDCELALNPVYCV
jgi:hypothetical protein